MALVVAERWTTLADDRTRHKVPLDAVDVQMSEAIRALIRRRTRGTRTRVWEGILVDTLGEMGSVDAIWAVVTTWAGTGTRRHIREPGHLARVLAAVWVTWLPGRLPRPSHR